MYRPSAICRNDVVLIIYYVHGLYAVAVVQSCLLSAARSLVQTWRRGGGGGVLLAVFNNNKKEDF